LQKYVNQEFKGVASGCPRFFLESLETSIEFRIKPGSHTDSYFFCNASKEFLTRTPTEHQRHGGTTMRFAAPDKTVGISSLYSGVALNKFNLMLVAHDQKLSGIMW
jgi:hypothetical protein